MANFRLKLISIAIILNYHLNFSTADQSTTCEGQEGCEDSARVRSLQSQNSLKINKLEILVENVNKTKEDLDQRVSVELRAIMGRLLEHMTPVEYFLSLTQPTQENSQTMGQTPGVNAVAAQTSWLQLLNKSIQYIYM